MNVRGPLLVFWCQSRLDSFTEDRTKLLKEMGCQSVSVGLEHGNEEVRRKEKKFVFPQKNLKKTEKI